MDWHSNLFWCIVGALFSLLISSIFYFVGLKRKCLTYEIKTFNIISDIIHQIKGLELKYNSNKVENLFSSTITLKNTGNSVIDKQDFAPSNPISFFTNGQFLVDKSDEKDLFQANTQNNIHPSLKFDNNNICNHITIDFDYIPKKQEFVCSLFHTGNISFSGILKDGRIINNDEYEGHQLAIIRIISIVLVNITCLTFCFLLHEELKYVIFFIIYAIVASAIIFWKTRH